MYINMIFRCELDTFLFVKGSDFLPGQPGPCLSEYCQGNSKPQLLRLPVSSEGLMEAFPSAALP